jgi:hypothetical protein
MRREVLVSSVSTIINDLKQCGVNNALDEALDIYRNPGNDKKDKLNIPLEVFRNYSIATSSYSDAELSICKIFGIEELLEVSFWKNFTVHDDPSNIFQMDRNIRFILDQLPKLIALFEQEHVNDVRDQVKDLPEELKGKTLLSVVLIEDKKQFSSPERLVHVLDAISKLYSVYATINGEGENDLIVLACDSGSDKSFDFLGMAKLMEQVKETIIQIWDRRVFYRQKHASECLSLIAESLPIIKEIDDLEKSKSLGPEQAELLKRKVIDGATKFIQSGALIEEMEGESIHSPRQLMRPEPKMLVSPWTEEANTEESVPEKNIKSSDESLSDEELEQLESLVKKAKKSKSTRKKQITKKKT